MDDPDTRTQVVKAGGVWFGVAIAKYLSYFGIHTWSDFAAFLASICSLLFIVEWLWKHLRKRFKRDTPTE